MVCKQNGEVTTQIHGNVSVHANGGRYCIVAQFSKFLNQLFIWKEEARIDKGLNPDVYKQETKFYCKYLDVLFFSFAFVLR